MHDDGDDDDDHDMNYRDHCNRSKKSFTKSSSDTGCASAGCFYESDKFSWEKSVN